VAADEAGEARPTRLAIGLGRTAVDRTQHTVCGLGPRAMSALRPQFNNRRRYDRN
jgi:hypothetical protein